MNFHTINPFFELFTGFIFPVTFTDDEEIGVIVKHIENVCETFFESWPKINCFKSSCQVVFFWGFKFETSPTAIVQLFCAMADALSQTFLAGIIRNSENSTPINGVKVTVDGKSYVTDSWESVFN
ncbi:MAG: hypothetical protein IIY06_09995, partial [Proteobacteria bacterium]|nr:hypothetical protein [Pseudomonadota bacterium]